MCFIMFRTPFANIKQENGTQCYFPVFLSGGADATEMRAEHHCPRFGARTLRAGNGSGPALHDQEGPHQHWCADGEAAAAAREIQRCEYKRQDIKKKGRSHVNALKKNNFVTLAEERYRHWCGGFRVGCCAAAAKFWHPGRRLPSPTSCPPFDFAE